MDIQQQIEEALANATPGPWIHEDGEVYSKSTKIFICGPDTPEEDAHLIANAPTWLIHQASIISKQTEEIERLRNMVEIVLYHHPNVDDPIDYESAYDDLKSQISAEYEKNPWIKENPHDPI